MEIYETITNEFTAPAIPPEALFKLDGTLQREGELEQAEAVLREFVDGNPEHPHMVKAALRLADLLAGPLGEPDEARAILLRAREKTGEGSPWRDQINQWLRELERVRQPATSARGRSLRDRSTPCR